MEESKASESHLTSAAAFVEGGIQDACDDACSICLEEFIESDPSTVTNCKHEFHLQCVLEWCQRSSKCPMCWQSISLKDPGGQELLDAVEHERNIRMNPPRNTTIFHHPTLGDFELQHLPVSATESELEERIIQHLAAAAAMGRARHIARREGQRSRSSAQGRPHFLVFSTNPNANPASAAASPPTLGGGGGGNEPAVMIAGAASPFLSVAGESTQLIQAPSGQADLVSASASGSSPVANQHVPMNNRYPNQSSPSSQDGAGPSDFHSFSESLKSRFSAMSMRYKESITKSTRGWKERLFSRNTTTQDLGSEGRRESYAGIATVTDMMEHLETRESTRNDIASVSNSQEHDIASVSNSQEHVIASVSNSQEHNSTPGLPDQQQHVEISGNHSSSEDGVQAPSVSSSSN